MTKQRLRYVFVTVLLLTCTMTVSFAQEDYYKNTNENFRQNKAFNEVIDVNKPDVERLDAVLFYLTNEIRLKKKLKELQHNDKLEESSTLHSQRMIEDKFFAHENPHSRKLKLPNDRARYVGIINPFLAENIVESFVLKYKAGDLVYQGGSGIFSYKPGGEPIKAHTYLSLGETLLDMWMDSPPHRENILSVNGVELGCGAAFFQREDFYDMPAVFVTQNFQFYEKVITKE